MSKPDREPDSYYRLSGDWTQRPAWVADTLAGLVDTDHLVPVEIDYEALAIWLADEDDMAGLFVASMDEYRRLARSHALRLGLEGGDDE